MTTIYNCPNCQTSMHIRIPNPTWSKVRSLVIAAKKRVHTERLDRDRLTVHIDFDTEADLSSIEVWELTQDTVTSLMANGFRGTFKTLYGVPIKYNAAKFEVVCAGHFSMS